MNALAPSSLEGIRGEIREIAKALLPRRGGKRRSLEARMRLLVAERERLEGITPLTSFTPATPGYGKNYFR